MIGHIIKDKEIYEDLINKDKSVSFELKMVIDDGSEVSPFVKMFSIDDFRDMKYKDIEEIIMKQSTHVARVFSHVILNRPDCLDGEID